MSQPKDESQDNDDLGEPIAELKSLSESPSGGFTRRILRTVERRSLMGQAVDLSWGGLFEVFRELLTAVFGASQAPNSQTSNSQPSETNGEDKI